MLMVSDVAGEGHLDTSFNGDARWLAEFASRATAAAVALRSGNVHRFATDRLDTEIVFGFRPGVDRIVIAAGSAGSDRILTTEDAGCVIIIDGQRRRIVLEGVQLADIVLGDVAIEACRSN